VLLNGKSKSILARPLPENIPSEGFNILLSSCFHAAEANTGYLESAVASLKSVCRPDLLSGYGRTPDLSLLLGDQVYLDLPTLNDLPKDKLELARIFEKKYLANWAGNRGFNHVLSASPFVAMADDHEFWNNYPHKSPIIQNSWTESGRENMTEVAEAMFKGFQESHPGGKGNSFIIDIAPVSIFVADTRRSRDVNDNTFMSRSGKDQLSAWVEKINADGHIGVFVSGQSMYSNPVSKWTGTVADWEFQNYKDFEEVAKILAKTRQKLILVTGDVHWGRVIKSYSTDPSNHADAFEVIVSPSALVTTVGSDQISHVKNFFSGLFGEKDLWPRHSEAETKIGPFTNEYVKPKRYHHKIMKDDLSGGTATLRGDHIGLLSFNWLGNKLKAKVRYWSIDGKPKPSRTVTLF
jgi:hypothetical protein